MMDNAIKIGPNITLFFIAQLSNQSMFLSMGERIGLEKMLKFNTSCILM